jgi:hypothetical protein
MMRLTPTPLAITFIVLLACTGASLAQTQTTDPAPGAPDFRVQIWGDLAADFSARIERYLELRRRLEIGLPPLTVTDDPADIGRAERALARKIRVALAGAKQGSIFDLDIRTEFRRVLLLTVDTGTRAAIMDENPGAFSHAMNGTYPKERSVSTVPGNVLAVLPRLPDDIQYRFLGPHLVLHDTRANIILDRLRCAIPCGD